MHFTISKPKLVNTISHVSKAVSTKTTIPILTGIKLNVDNKGITLTASDSDITIQVFIPTMENDEEIVKIHKLGKIILPRYIVDIVKKLPEDEIEFKMLDSLTVLIKSGLSEFRLNGFDAEEFPNLPIINEENTFTIPSELLKTMIKQTIFAVSTNESRPILTGVLWQLEKQKLKFVATDSHRLAVREAMVDILSDISFNNIVVPGKALSELNKILEDDQAIVQIVVTDNQILLKKDNILFLSRLLDGTYPDISRIIPDQEKTKINLKTRDILDSIERASLISKDAKNNIVKFVTLENLMVEITSTSFEIGKVTEHIKAKDFNGESIKIAFNARYMLDALKTIDSEEIYINFTGALSPIIVKPVEHDKMLHLILPVRT